MSDKARNVYALACFVLAGAGVALLLVLTGFGPAGRDDRTAGGDGRAGNASADPFTIGGDVLEPISPGVMVGLNLEFSNARAVPLSLLELTVTVSGVDAPHADQAHPCTPDDFIVVQISRSLDVTLPAGATLDLGELGVPSTGWPQVGMVNLPVNQDGCKGSTVTLDYTASAKVVGR